MDNFAQAVINTSSIILPLLAIWLLARCVRSMLSEKYEPEIWAYLEAKGGETAAIRHWECIIGRAKACDIVIKRENVSRTQAALIRSDKGKWKFYNLDFNNEATCGGLEDEGKGIWVDDGDEICLGGTVMKFRDLDETQRAAVDKGRAAPGRRIMPSFTLLILTVFQALLALQFTVSADREHVPMIALGFAAIMLLQWSFYSIMRAMDRTGFEVETLAFFLSSLGMAVCATSTPGDILKQLILLIAGLVFFIFLGWWLRDLSRVKVTRWLVGLAGLGFLALNLLAGETQYGAQNWLTIGGFSLQPSEFVKIAYIYAGGATLDRLFRGRNLFMFIGFSAINVGALALMGDFGTAVIFFCTFLVISFMRSGSFATVFLAVAGAALACMLVLTVKPYIAQRFATWGHIWEDPYGTGWQQTRGLAAAASGGLFGVGAGKGWLKDIFAADTDMVFCVMCEELGLIIALCAMFAIIILALFTVRNAAQGRSSFFVIAACAATSMMMVQLALNVFGCTDILPFTGVTFPFVSKGGSSLISCWALLAFIKAGDTRHGASFSVKLSSRAIASYGEEDDDE